jgi:hypothetical protein
VVVVAMMAVMMHRAVMHHAMMVVAVMVNRGGCRRGSHGKTGNADKNSEVVFHVFRRRLVLRPLGEAVQLRKVVQRKNPEI